MIDRVVQQAGPPAVRGAGRLQVVRAGPVRRLVLLRRRGERRRELPAPRRHRVDHRQGRPDHGPAGGRDHRPHRQGSRRALPRADGGVRHAVLHAHRRAGDAGAEGAASASCPRGGEGVDAGRRADHRQADARPGQRRADRRAEGGGRERLVRGAARPARRTSTRSTPRASATRPTCTRSWARRRRSCRTPDGPEAKSLQLEGRFRSRYPSHEST